MLLDNWKLGNARFVYKGEMNEPLEDAVEKTLKRFAYWRVAKGYDLNERIGEVLFCKEKRNEGAAGKIRRQTR